jgi:ADP-ribose pyrophosphatase YjhB (NUDIX family)
VSDEKLQRWLEFSRSIPTTGKASLAIVQKDSLLLSISRENDPDDWTLPGGKLEPGESWLTGLVREVREETGVEVISANLVHEGESDDDHYVRVYSCRLAEYPETFPDNPEGVVKWVKPHELVKGCFRKFNMLALSAAGVRLSP